MIFFKEVRLEKYVVMVLSRVTDLLIYFVSDIFFKLITAKFMHIHFFTDNLFAIVAIIVYFNKLTKYNYLV